MNKKILIISVSVLLAIFLILGIIIFCFMKKDSIIYNKLKSNDEKFEIELPSSLEYTKNENTSFSIDLYSANDEVYIYASTISNENSLDLMQAITMDQTLNIENKQNLQNLSDIVSGNIKDYNFCEYSFTYFDSSYEKDFFSNVIWIQSGNTFYVLNFEVIMENVQKYKSIFDKIKNSFCEV